MLAEPTANYQKEGVVSCVAPTENTAKETKQSCQLVISVREELCRHGWGVGYRVHKCNHCSHTKLVYKEHTTVESESCNVVEEHLIKIISFLGKK